MNHQDRRLRALPAVQGTMTAALLDRRHHFSLVDVPIPEPRPGEVRVRMEGCGVCASNLEPWSGPAWLELPLQPGALGHEAWGVVDAVGEGVGALAPGQRVATLFQSSFADYECGPASQVLPLPASIDDAFPGEPLACAMNIFRRCAIEPGQTVAVVGIGFLGAILTRLITDAGAQVIAMSRSRSALDLACSNGALHSVVLDEPSAAVEAVKSVTDGRFCECVVEATGKQGPLALAGELAGVRGRLVIAGYHQDGPRQVNMQSWNWRGLDVINAHERDPAIYLEGMREAIGAVSAGRLDVRRLVTHAFPLERINDAFEIAQARPDGFLKAVVTMA